MIKENAHCYLNLQNSLNNNKKFTAEFESTWTTVQLFPSGSMNIIKLSPRLCLEDYSKILTWSLENNYYFT